MKDNTKANRLTNTLFVIYMVALVWIIVFKFGLPFAYIGNIRSINLIPFSASMIVNGKIHYSEIILNVMIFVPLGIYAGVLLHRWSIVKKLSLIFLFSLLCEVIQYIFGIGASDITDLITNTLGGIIGFMIYKGIEKAFKDAVKAQKFINILAATGTIFIISALLLLKISNLWIFRS